MNKRRVAGNYSNSIPLFLLLQKERLLPSNPSRWALPLLMVAALASAVEGQVPDTAPTANLEIALTNVPDSATPGSSFAIPTNVTLNMGNFACPASATMKVTLAMATSNYATFTIEPATLEFTVSAGFSGGGAYSQTKPASISTTIQGRVPANQTLTLNMTASFAGGQVGNCQANGPIPAAETSVEEDVAILVQNATQPTGPGASMSGDSTEDSKDSPAASWILVSLVLIALANRRLR